MEIGWTVDKGLAVLKISYQIYKAFRDPDTNAPRQFRDLAREFSAFHTVFAEYLEVVEKHKKPLLLPPSSIQYTLDKCRLFQEKFGILGEVTTKKSIKHGIAVSLRTLQWSFLANELANTLRAELACHTRILSWHTGTIGLHNAFEERVENHEIREQNREILHLLKTQRQMTTEHLPLDFPQVPQHTPLATAHTELNLPEVPQHEPMATVPSSGNRLAQLEMACRNLEALDHLLDTEQRAISDLHLPSDNGSTLRNTTDFITLARQDLELQYKRISNYHKRMQRLSSQSHSWESEISELGTMASRRSSHLEANNTWQGTESAEPNKARTIPYRIQRTGSSATGDFPSIGISTSNATDVPYRKTSLRSRRESIARRSASIPDDVSIALQQYIEKFEGQLEELDQHDIDSQIAKTRDELFSFLQISLPPSPDLRLASLSPGGSPSGHASPRVDGLLSSSPTAFGSNFTSSRRPTVDTVNSRRGSLDDGSWRYLAKNVNIVGIRYSCFRCKSIELTALQFARRASGGLCFRLLCLNSSHRPGDGILFRHNLISGSPGYPHVYHFVADRGSENIVYILGQPAKLEAYIAGHKTVLQVLTNCGLSYKFQSQDESETFQQLVYGARLIQRFDVKSVTSSAYSGHPTRNVAVRVWESISSGSLSIMFRGLLVDKVEAISYCEHASAFISPPSASGNKVKLKLLSASRSPSFSHRRTGSASSNVSDLNGASHDSCSIGGPGQNIRTKIKWIEIEFENRDGRDGFLRAWKGGAD